MAITLTNQRNQLVINASGAYIELLQLDDHKILTSATRGDNKRGATHPCSPQFGPETETHYGLPSHGIARTIDWQVKEQNDTEAILIGNLDHDGYPRGMTITQTFRLTEKAMNLETNHANNGSSPAPINFAEHFYWHTPRGWDNVMLNNESIAPLAKTTGVTPLKEENELYIPGLPPIQLVQVGLPIATVWTYYNVEDTVWDTDYVCIEPSEGQQKSTFFGSPTSFIAPGAERITELRIAL